MLTNNRNVRYTALHESVRASTSKENRVIKWWNVPYLRR